jgi:hypothetical protein
LARVPVVAASSGAIELKVWLLAGGGGGAGSDPASSIHGNAGGGAGGLVDSTFTVATGKTYVVTVGAGGGTNVNGNDSIFEVQGVQNLVPRLVSYGGGGGNNKNGGCGSGGYYTGNSTTFGGLAVLNQGRNGGGAATVQYNSRNTAGGGGGIAAVGTYNPAAGPTGLAGGLGTTAYTSLLALVGEGRVVGANRYVGTGGDSSNNAGNSYTYGSGGTFSGTTNQYGAGTGGGVTVNSIQPGGNAAAFTGSGGGGGYPGGSGSSGFVIIYYPTSVPQITATGNPSYYTDGVYHYYKFKSSGTVTF